MATASVVEAVDVLAEALLGGRKILPIGVELELEREPGEEALRDSVVPAVTLAAHAHADAVASKRPLIRVAGVVHAAVAVVHQPGRRATKRERTPKGLYGNGRAEVARDSSTDDAT